jgi:hypothetical protein
MAWWNVVANPLFLIAIVVALLVLWVLGALFLSIGLSVVKGKKTEFGNIMITVLIGVILALFLPWYLGWILYWYIIKIRHDTDWGGAVIAWFLAWVIPVLILAVVFAFVIVIVGFSPLFPF